MEETLTIRNFGPIKDVTLDLRKINIFIGDQGTGKSTVAKVLAVLKTTISYHHIGKNEVVRQTVRNTIEENFKFALKRFDLTYSLKNSFLFLKYDCYFLKYENEKIVFDFGETDEYFGNSVFSFIPSYREVAILLKDNLFALMSTNTTLPQILTFFGDNFTKAKNEIGNFNYSDIFDVTFSYKSGNDIIILNNNNFILLNEASSAINSGVPMLVVHDYLYHKLKTYYEKNRKFLTIIEEPELNCFPLTQKKIVTYFIEKLILSQNQLLITTHSPYILTSLNNLMYAYVVGQKDKVGVNKIIEEKYWVNPEDVSCYFMNDGYAEPIMNYKEGMIKAEIIDSVSAIINKEFDELIKLEINLEAIEIQ